MLTSYEIFRRFSGIWRFQRQIVSVIESQPSGEVTGLAEFKEVASNLMHYSEIGTFETDAGKKIPIKQEYFFTFNESTKKIEKHYAKDGAPNGMLYAISNKLEGEHLCKDDNYKAKYGYVNDDFKEFTLDYDVLGPHKNYTSKTTYTFSS